MQDAKHEKKNTYTAPKTGKPLIIVLANITRLGLNMQMLQIIWRYTEQIAQVFKGFRSLVLATKDRLVAIVPTVALFEVNSHLGASSLLAIQVC